MSLKFSSQHIDNENGQAITETVVVFMAMFLLVMGCFHVARFLAIKNTLSAITHELASDLATHSLLLTQYNDLQKIPGGNNDLSPKLAAALEQKLLVLQGLLPGLTPPPQSTPSPAGILPAIPALNTPVPKAPMRLYVTLRNVGGVRGVHVHINTCASLFGMELRVADSTIPVNPSIPPPPPESSGILSDEMAVDAADTDGESVTLPGTAARDCLGVFATSPFPALSIKTFSFAPFGADVDVFEKGWLDAQKIRSIDLNDMSSAIPFTAESGENSSRKRVEDVISKRRLVTSVLKFEAIK